MTDLFALSIALYFIRMDHEVFSELGNANGKDKIERLFHAGVPHEHQCMFKSQGKVLETGLLLGTTS